MGPLSAEYAAISTDATTLSNQRIKTRLEDILSEIEGYDDIRIDVSEGSPA